MKIESLQLNVEVLVPGILQTAILCRMFPDLLDMIPNHPGLPGGQLGAEFITLATFLAAAYAVGVFCTFLARFLMDGPADWSFTPLLLRACEPEDFRDLRPLWRQRRNILKRYRQARNSEVCAAEPALSIIVKYRRLTQTLRACTIPAMSCTWLLFDTSYLLRFGLVAVTYLVSLFIFAYCEVALYQQCRKIDDENAPTRKQGNQSDC